MDVDFEIDVGSKTVIAVMVALAVVVAAFFTCVIHGVGIWFGAG